MGRDRVADGRALRHAAEVVIVVAFFFWTAVGLLVFTQVGYPVVLWALARLRRSRPADAPEAASRGQEPSVSVIVAAHDEEAVIARRVANLLELDYPRDQLEVIVASDGSEDRTVELARAAGADEVLDLDRVGKIAAQNEAARRASGVVLAFSDANATWAPDALRALLARFEDPRVAYVCGQVSFTSETGQNQEGLYWRYEMALRTLESELGGVTAGNGAIYAVRRDAYMYLGPSRSHDLSFPFELTKRGHRALYAAEAVASEKLVPTLEGEPIGLEIDAGTQHGQLFKLRGRGVPHLRGGGRGDLLVRTHVVTPTKVTDEQRDLLEQLASSLGTPAIPRDSSLFDRIKDAFG